MTAEVFVSYSHCPEDRRYVDQLVQHLRQAGVSVWFDRDIAYRQLWESEIRARISACVALIVVMTPAAQASRWVAREISEAEFLGRPVLPVLLAGERFFRLNDLQYEDVTDHHMPSDQFVRTLEALTRREQQSPVDVPARTPQPRLLISVDVPNFDMKSVDFSPDGQTLITVGSAASANLWDVSNPSRPARIASLQGHKSFVDSVAFAPDGRVVATASYDKTVRLWDVAQPEQPRCVATLDHPDR